MNTKTAKLVYVIDAPIADKNGNTMMWGRTSEFIDDAGVFHSGKLVTCYNEDLFDRFVVGLEVAL